jgi:endonuclease G
MIGRVVVFVCFLILLYNLLRKYISSAGNSENNNKVSADVSNLEQTGTDRIYYLPTTQFGSLVKHHYYALSYAENFELAEWLAYELTSERLNKEWVKRSGDFRPDTKIATGSATPDDYRGSSFDRGHLVPAADMAFSDESMSETFLMSNMAPQVREFNGGIWRELEELSRDWVRRFKHLYIVTGPVLTDKPLKYIGQNKVAVPQRFYKVLLDLREPEIKAIAFMIPNAVSERPVMEYALSVDSLETITGINFFANLLDKSLEERLEAEFDPKLWKTNQKKYEIRVKYWNKR